jgi:mannose-6-phosphate isomerase-like protein (cupin superfamily)
MMLSRALGVDIAQLIGPTPSSASAPLGGGGRRVVERAGDGRVIETQSYTHVYLATELLNKRATPLTGETNVRTVEEFLAEFGDLMRHPGEEFAFVLEGEIQFHTEIYAPVRLKVGDSVYFDSEMGHAYLKAADGPCRMVVVCIPRGGSDTVMETFASVSERNAAQATAGASATPAAPQMKVTRRSGTKHTPRRRS